MFKKLFSLMALMMFVLTVCVGCGQEKKAAPKQEVTVRIAAAASLEKAFVQKLIPLYTAKNSHVKIIGSYDASGKLQKQIEQGMQADIFFSAGVKQMTALESKNFVDKASVQPLLENKLVLIVPAAGKSELKTFADMAKAKQPAIGDPKSVPAGQYAKEALTGLKLWSGLEQRLSLGTNVVQVLNWVAEGSADAGLVYASDAATNKRVKVIAEAPAGSLKKKVIYPIGVLSKAPQTQEAQAFVAFLKSEEAAKVFKEYGFAVAK